MFFHKNKQVMQSKSTYSVFVYINKALLLLSFKSFQSNEKKNEIDSHFFITGNLINRNMGSSVEHESINCENTCKRYIGRNINANLTPFPFSFS